MGLTLSEPKQRNSRKKQFGTKKKLQNGTFPQVSAGRGGPGRAGAVRAGSEFDLDVICGNRRASRGEGRLLAGTLREVPTGLASCI